MPEYVNIIVLNDKKKKISNWKLPKIPRLGSLVKFSGIYIPILKRKYIIFGNIYVYNINFLMRIYTRYFVVLLGEGKIVGGEWEKKNTSIDTHK